MKWAIGQCVTAKRNILMFLTKCISKWNVEKNDKKIMNITNKDNIPQNTVKNIFLNHRTIEFLTFLLLFIGKVVLDINVSI